MEIFNQSKYTKWYKSIVEKANGENRNKKDSYFESHHIIPRSLGGSNKKNNLVLLKPREHFICHLLLTKMCLDGNDHHKMIYAAIYMAKLSKVKINSHTYDILKQKHLETLAAHWTPERRALQAEVGGRTKHTEESRKNASDRLKEDWSNPDAKEKRIENMSKSLKGRKAPNKGIPMSEEQKKKVSESKKGISVHSEESRRKMSEQRKGRIPWNKGLSKESVSLVSVD